METDDYIALEDQFGAHNYHPLDVVLVHGQNGFRFAPPLIMNVRRSIGAAKNPIGIANESVDGGL